MGSFRRKWVRRAALLFVGQCCPTFAVDKASSGDCGGTKRDSLAKHARLDRCPWLGHQERSLTIQYLTYFVNKSVFESKDAFVGWLESTRIRHLKGGDMAPDGCNELSEALTFFFGECCF